MRLRLYAAAFMRALPRLRRYYACLLAATALCLPSPYFMPPPLSPFSPSLAVAAIFDADAIAAAAYADICFCRYALYIYHCYYDAFLA